MKELFAEIRRILDQFDEGFTTERETLNRIIMAVTIYFNKEEK